MKLLNKKPFSITILLSSSIVSILGLTVLIGWHTNTTLLIQIQESFVPMQYNTALGFLLSGIGLFSIHFNFRRINIVAGVLLIFLGFLTLLQYVFGLELGIDQLFMEHSITTKTSHPGRMAPNTALCFFIAGWFMLCNFIQSGFHKEISLSVLSSLIVALGMVALTGYFCEVESAYGWGNLTRMAIHTSLGFIVFGIGAFRYVWRISKKKANIPTWFYIIVGISTTTMTVLLWQALYAISFKPGLINNSVLNLPVTILIFGIILSLLLATASFFWQNLFYNRDLLRQSNKEISGLYAALEQKAQELDQNNQTLIKSNAYLESTLSSSADGIVMLDKEEKFTYVNPAFLKLLNRDENDFLGKTVSEIIPTFLGHEATKVLAERVRNRVKYGGLIVGKEVEFINKKGEIIPISYSASGIIDKDGNTIGEIAIARDITKQKKAEQELIIAKEKAEESEIKLLKAQQIASVGFLNWDLITDQIELSEQTVIIFGIEPDKKWLTPDFIANIVHPEDIEFVKSNLELAIKGEKKYNIDHRIIRTNGDIIWVQAQADLYYDSEGNPKTLLGTVIDISQRKLAEEQYRAFFQENVSPVYWLEMKNPVPVDLPVEEQVDMIFKEAYFKDASDKAVQYYGYQKRDELIGKSLPVIWIPECTNRDHSTHQYFQTFVKAGHALFGTESLEETQAGEDKWFLGNLRGIVEDGYLLRIWGSQIDITERKKAEKILLENERKKAIDEIALTSSEIGLYEYDTNSGQMTYAPSTNKLYGLSSDKMPDKIDGFFQLLHEDDKKGGIEKWNKIVNSDKVKWANEYRIVKSNGEVVWIRDRAHIKRDENKKLISVLGTVVNISKEKEVELSLKKSEKLLRQVSENYPNSYMSIINKDFTIEYTSGQEFKNQSIDPNQFIGHSIDEVFGNDASLIKKRFSETFKGKHVSFEHFIDNQCMENRVIPLKDENGEINKILSVAENITKRKEYEKELLKAKETAEESEKYLRTLIEKSPLPMVITDEKQDIEFFNEKFTEHFGYTVKDVSTAEKWWEMAYPDIEYRQKVQNAWIIAIDKAMRHNTDIKMQVWDMTTKKRTKRTCEFYMVPIGKRNLIIVNDITERRKNQFELREAKERAEKNERGIRERIKELQGIYSLGLLTEKYEDLHLIFSELVYDIIPNSMQYPECAYVLLDIEGQLYCNIDSYSLPEGKDYLAARIVVFKMPAGKLIVSYTKDLQFIELFEQKLIDVYAERISKIVEQTKTKQELVYAKDKAEKAMIEAEVNEKKFRDIISKSHVGIGVYDETGQCIAVNESFTHLIGATKKEALSQNWHSIESWKKGNLFATAQQALMENTTKRKTFEFKSSFGKMLVVDCYLIPFSSNGLLLMLNDVSEQKKVQKELESAKEKAEKAKIALEQTLGELRTTQERLINSEKMASIGILSAGVAHEINNPINYISSGMIGLRKCYDKIVKNLNEYRVMQNPDAPEIQQFQIDNEQIINQTIEFSDDMFRSIQEGIDKTVEIISSMRAFSRSSEDVFTELSINDSIDAALLMLFNSYKHKIEVIKNYTKESVVVAVSGKLHQVFMNVITNAIQAIPESGTITITTQWNNRGDRIIINIKDTGNGISGDAKRKVFDPFFSTKEVGKGTGLGLYISYNIIEQHHGSIKFKSKEHGGTEFTIELPK